MQKEKSAPILLAEDHPVNQKVALILLERFGYTADAVATGRQAVDAFEKNDYDLILMDVMMPDMDGLEATQLIRESEKTSGGHVPIIALTAMAMVGDRERCIQSGMDDYITKPIDPELLRAKLMSWIDHKNEPNPSTAESIIAWDQLNRTYSEEQIEDILRVFLNITSSLCQDIEIGVQREDWATVERVAHELKGSSAAIYARPLQDLCLQLEQCARTDHDKARQLIPQVRQSFAALEKLINNHSASAANK